MGRTSVHGRSRLLCGGERDGFTVGTLLFIVIIRFEREMNFGSESRVAEKEFDSADYVLTYSILGHLRGAPPAVSFWHGYLSAARGGANLCSPDKELL